MTPKNFLNDILEPAIAQLTSMLPGISFDAKAKVMLMAIAGQESTWTERIQISGPAHSYWQFEEYGGVAEVLQKCPKQIAAVCEFVDCPASRREVYITMTGNDVLAVAMARLLLWQDPAALPDLGQRDAAWNYYLRNWRPGAPHPEVWPNRYGTALALVGGGT